MDAIGSRLRFLRKKLGFNQEDFASLIGTGRSNLSRMESGTYPPGKAQLLLLKEKLHVNPGWIMEGEEPLFLEEKKTRGQNIPILASIPAGPWEHWIDTYTAGAGDDYIAVPADIKGENLFAVRVKGDSMEPRLHDGDILIINPHQQFANGIAVVRHKSGYKIRLVRKNINTYILTPLNPAHAVEEITPDETTKFYVPVKRISMQDI